MHQKLSESVRVVFDQSPISLTWVGREYQVTQLGLHHTYLPAQAGLQGQALQHIYSVVAGNLFFRLHLDSTSLAWTLEEISDGLPD